MIVKVVEHSIKKMTRVVNLHKEPYGVYIGRGSKWGNPYIIRQDGTREEVIEKYRLWILTQQHLMYSLHALKGKILGCFCKPKACHGDILVELIESIKHQKLTFLSYFEKGYFYVNGERKTYFKTLIRFKH